MNKSVSTAAAVAFVAGALIAVGGTAYGSDLYSSYNKVLPIASQDGYVSAGTAQDKYVANKAGNIKVTFVGSDYTIQARLCSWAASNCGARSGALGDNSATTSLPNSLGSTVGLIASAPLLGLNVKTWNAVTVQTTGTWRSW